MPTRKTNKQKLSPSQLAAKLRASLDELKAEDISLIDLAGKSDFADFMIVASGTSQRHVASLAERVVKTLKEMGVEHVPTEGKETGDWVLVDAGSVIVHLFRPETRTYYNIEKMWSMPVDAPVMLVKSKPTASSLEAAF